MKLTKREQILLIILTTMVIIYGYFQFIIEPQLTRWKALQISKDKVESEMEMTKTLLSSSEQIEKEYSSTQGELNMLSKGFLSSIDQDYLLMLITDLLQKSGMYVSNIEFSPLILEEIAKQNIEVLTVTLPYHTNYESLFDFLKKVREYEKKIIIKSLSIENGEDGQLTGNILLDFYKIGNGTDEKMISSFSSQGGYSTDNPFSPYEGYQWQNQSVEETLEGGSMEIRGNNTYSSPPVEDAPKKTLIHSFEKMNSFLIGNPKTIVGKIELDKNHKQGKAAIRVQYDFLRPRKDNRINVVFDGEEITIPKQAESISLWIYAFEKSDHNLGIVLRDAIGREYNITLTDTVDWSEWKCVEAKLPIEMTYPVEVQRIYIESTNLDGKTRGTFLYDQLEVEYPEVLPYSNEMKTN